MLKETIIYETEGTCSERISLSLAEGKIAAVNFEGGCAGNLVGLSRLLVGMDAAEAVGRLKGIRCGENETSCPDQLARAIESALLEKRT